MGTYTGTALEQQAHRDWAAGKVIPHRITTALDAHSLYGPEVDRACGVEEPAVDRWEAGTLYPTWEQLRALATLCEVLPHLFTIPDTGPIQGFICDRSKRKNGCQRIGTSDRITAFTPAAIAAANLPRLPPPPDPPRPPTGRRRLRQVA